MMEILPIKHLTDEDIPIFGNHNVALDKLHRTGLPVANGIIATAPLLHLKTTLEHFDFGHKEIFEQSLTLVKKELEKIPVPEDLKRETSKHNKFLINGQVIGSVSKLWQTLLFAWIDQIKQRLWKDGFYPGITEGLDSQIIIFIKSLDKPKPLDLKKILELEEIANKKLFLTHKYEWIIDNGVKLAKVLPFTPTFSGTTLLKSNPVKTDPVKTKSVIKVFLDLSTGLIIEEDIEGVYIQAEKISDWEELVHKIVESAITYADKPVLVKLAGSTLDLIHQKSLFDPLIQALDFARHKKGLNNVHIVIPFVRIPNELIQIKRDLAIKKLMRKNSLQLWMEIALPENIINLEEYIMQGIDGVVLNLDELIAHLGGFDHKNEELSFYKKEVAGLLKFLEDGIKIIHKSKVPFIAVGNIVLEKEVLEFLVQKGVYGIVVEKYDSASIRDLLHQTEKRMILIKSE